MIIAIDGPAGAGKSTVARELAARLRYVYIDTGAMYRTVALKVIREGIPESEDSVEGLVSKLSVRFCGGDEGFSCFLDDEDVTGEIRSSEVSQIASKISCFGSVREEMVRLQRELGRDGGVVLEGRDIGTVVFPNADLKVFLDAAPLVRAERRMRDLERAGQVTNIEETLAELAVRDERDQNRQNSPLTRAIGALDLDTTWLSCEEVVSFLESVILDMVR